LIPLKTAINIFIFLAVTAFTLDVVTTFAVQNAVKELSKVADADDETDSEDCKCDPDSEEEEGEESPVKELFLEQFEVIIFEPEIAGNKAYFTEYTECSSLHKTAPPYSPPEFV